MLTHLPPTATGAEVAAVMQRDGGVIVDDLATGVGQDDTNSRHE